MFYQAVMEAASTNASTQTRTHARRAFATDGNCVLTLKRIKTLASKAIDALDTALDELRHTKSRVPGHRTVGGARWYRNAGRYTGRACFCAAIRTDTVGCPT